MFSKLRVEERSLPVVLPAVSLMLTMKLKSLGLERLKKPWLPELKCLEKL